MLDVYLAYCRLPSGPGRSHPQLAAMAQTLKLTVLAQHCGCSVGQLDFERDEHGKPLLRDPPGWHFNLSHSRDVAVLAVARQPLGVDVEYQARRANWKAIAERLFSAQENQQLAAWTAELHDQRATQLWTAKEAWAKATGLGVTGLAQAPQFQWSDGCWRLPDAHADQLCQRCLADEIWLSLYLEKASGLQLHWQGWQWSDNGLRPDGRPAVTEFPV